MKIIYISIMIIINFLWIKFLFFSNRGNLKYKLSELSLKSTEKYVDAKRIIAKIRFVENYRNKKNIYNKNKELYFIILQIQNLIITHKKSPVSMNYTVSQVLSFCEYTKNAFMKFLYYYNLNDREVAVKNFKNEIPSPLARDLVYILADMDYLNPSEVLEQFELLEDRIKSEMRMNRELEEEKISNFLYIMPVVLCFMILLNYIVVIMKVVRGYGVF